MLSQLEEYAIAGERSFFLKISPLSQRPTSQQVSRPGDNNSLGNGDQQKIILFSKPYII